MSDLVTNAPTPMMQDDVPQGAPTVDSPGPLFPADPVPTTRQKVSPGADEKHACNEEKIRTTDTYEHYAMLLDQRFGNLYERACVVHGRSLAVRHIDHIAPTLHSLQKNKSEKVNLARHRRQMTPRNENSS